MKDIVLDSLPKAHGVASVPANIALLQDRLARELQENERQYRELVEGLPAAVYTTDHEGRIVLFNHAAAALWGREPGPEDAFWGPAAVYDALGSPLAAERCPVRKVLEGFPGAHNAELILERGDGVRRHVLANPRPIHDALGRVAGAINTLVDISDRKQAEAELAATKDQLAAQVEGLTHLHELSIRLGGIDDMQRAVEAVLDTAVESQQADFGLVWLQEPESGDLVVHASRGFEGEKAMLFERVKPGAEGGAAGNAFQQKRRWIVEDIETDPSFAPFRDAARRGGFRAVHSTPIVTRSGGLLGALSVHFRQPRRPSHRDRQVADVCARYAADAIEGLQNREMLRESWARIALDNDRLKQVESELRELDERKNEFLATLAHELRNPLAPLRNGLELMRIARGDARALERARSMMERQLAHMVRLVDDLLDMSRVSRGKIELKRSELEFAAVLRSAVETSKPLIDERGHKLTVDLPGQRIVVNGDLTRLSQVFGNLLNNAAKYTEPGGRIALTARLGGGFVETRVKDNGIGIPAGMRSRIFEIFMQVDRPMEKSQGGLGIGLSIARRLVEMHEGTIEAVSAGPGKGSEFVVRIPARIAAAPAGPVRQPLESRPGAGLRILVADDHEDAAATLSMMLEVLGHEVAVARDGQHAAELAYAFRPDMVLMDIGMPRLNGYEACRRIRSQPWSTDVFMVALTGWGQKEDKERSRAAGFERHLVKPVEPTALAEVLEAARASAAAR